MKNLDDIVKRFKFDLQMGVFKRYPYMNNTTYAFKGSEEDIGFLGIILDYLGFEECEEEWDVDSSDDYVLLVDVKLSNYYYDMADFEDYENDIPDYIKGS